MFALVRLFLGNDSVNIISMLETGTTYLIHPDVSSEQLDQLFAGSWPNLAKVLQKSLTYVCAYQDGRLIGFVNVAWDGDSHAFLLDPTVHPEFRRRGIGSELVRLASAAARDANVEWIHVDFEPYLADFYSKCGFVPTSAGLIRLRD